MKQIFGADSLKQEKCHKKRNRFNFSFETVSEKAI